MCGINGIIWKNSLAVDKDLFYKSAKLTKHRGPDFTGKYDDKNIILVHHRLSILDLDKRSNQPFSNNQHSSVLVYNGEIYNYRALSEKHNLFLETTSDTEVLYSLINKPDFDYKELNGIFAFALYDKNKNTLQLTRDRLGVKPLYYYENDDIFIFSSEAKVIYNYLPKLEINYQALSEFVSFGSSISNETIIEGVKKLNPGSSLIIDMNDYSTKLKQFWSIKKEIAGNQINLKYDQALTKTRNLLEMAVERQCISDVQVGAYLSGGIDSSAVVALASKYTSKKLNTYSVSFDKNPVSELKLAAKIAKKYGTNHHEFEVSTNNIDDFLEELVFQYDEPFADPAMIPLYLMAKKASNFSKVVLQGDGGDEVFAGYGRHLDLKHYTYRKTIYNFLKVAYPNKEHRQYYAKKYFALSHSSFSHVMANLVQSDLQLNPNKLFLSKYHSKFQSIDVLKQYKLKNENFKVLPLMQRMLYTDMEIILPHTFLEKVDKVNMMHAIEARVPLLDNDLVNYVMQLPQDFKIKNSTTKYFLREVLKDIVPTEILKDRKKSFGTPIPEWLRTTLYDYTMDIFEKSEKLNFPINYTEVKNMLKNHKSNKENHNSSIIWRVLILSIWFNLYKDKLEYGV